MKNRTVATIAVLLLLLLLVAGAYFWPEVQISRLDLPAYEPEVSSLLGFTFTPLPPIRDDGSHGYHASSFFLGFGREIVRYYDPSQCKFDDESNSIPYVVHVDIRYFAEIREYFRRDN